MTHTIVLLLLLGWGLFALGYSLGLLWVGKQLITNWEHRKSRYIWRRNVVLASGLLVISSVGLVLGFI